MADPAPSERLRTDGLTVRHGGVVALSNVSITAGAGEMVGLIGPNGAGKSTFVDAVSGMVDHQGAVLVDGQDVGALAAHDRVRAGLARTWQSVELFDGLSVAEQCTVALAPTSRAPMWSDLVRRRRRGLPEPVGHVLELLGLADDADRPASSLPAGRGGPRAPGTTRPRAPARRSGRHARPTP